MARASCSGGWRDWLVRRAGGGRVRAALVLCSALARFLPSNA